MEQIAYQIVNNRKIATVFHDSGDKKVAIFCHGFRSSSIGPNRFFVPLARSLENAGICVLRFDQYGSGNSEGAFFDSSFNDWVYTTNFFIEKYATKGYKVALLGQSMGGAAALVSASKLQDKLSSVVAWTPGIVTHPPKINGEYMEENGQRVSWQFWTEAYTADVISSFQNTKIPELIFFASDDEYVSQEDQNAFMRLTKPNHTIEILKNHKHSSWSFDQAKAIMQKSLSFIVENI